MQPSSSAFGDVYSRAYHRRYAGLEGSSADVCRPSRCPRTVDKTLVVCQYFHFYLSYFLSISVNNTPVLGCPHVPSVLPVSTSFFLLYCHHVGLCGRTKVKHPSATIPSSSLYVLGACKDLFFSCLELSRFW